MKCCKTCKFSRWYLTPNGKIKKFYSGTCVVPVPAMPMLPSCFKLYEEPVRFGIWPEDGGDCQAYEESDGKPLPEGVP